MGWISRAGWVAVGYLLGARAGTDRYDQIVTASQRVLARPELQRSLTPVTDRLRKNTPSPSAGHAAGGLGTASAEMQTAATVGVPPPGQVPSAAVAPEVQLPDPVTVVTPPEPPATPPPGRQARVRRRSR